MPLTWNVCVNRLRASWAGRLRVVAWLLLLVIPFRGEGLRAAEARDQGTSLTVVTDHFTVSFRGPEDAALASMAVESLDKAFWRISQTLNVYPLRRVPVVFSTAEEFRDMTGAPLWAAGAYDGTIRVPIRGGLDRREELDRILAHEYTHALAHTLAPRGVPTWLSEGLAGAMERDSIEWAVHRVAQAGGPMPLAYLLVPFGRLDRQQAEIAYSTSALAVRRLLDEAGGVAISNLLHDLGTGEPFERAFAHRMARPFREFIRSLEQPN